MVRAGNAGQFGIGGSTGATVLLVEEDPVVRKSLLRALASEGFVMQGADPGAMMEAALERQAYHAVLVSVEGGTGDIGDDLPASASSPGYRRRSSPPDWGRIRRVRRLHPAGRLVVLTVTAPSHPGAAFEGDEVDAFVEKPVAVAMLVALLRDMLETHEAVSESDPHTF